jgi:hypothetical protein
MEKIKFYENKVLKLNNVLIKEVELKESADFSLDVLGMENYIKSKGTVPIGPLTQKTVAENDRHGNPNIKLFLLRQSKDFIHHVESPYKMESVLRITDCLYARFCDEEKNIKYAYDKLGLFAYENDIVLKNETYAVFVNQTDDKLTADIFMERKHD